MNTYTLRLGLLALLVSTQCLPAESGIKPQKQGYSWSNILCGTAIGISGVAFLSKWYQLNMLKNELQTKPEQRRPVAQRTSGRNIPGGTPFVDRHTVDYHIHKHCCGDYALPGQAAWLLKTCGPGAAVGLTTALLSGYSLPFSLATGLATTAYRAYVTTPQTLELNEQGGQLNQENETARTTAEQQRDDWITDREWELRRQQIQREHEALLMSRGIVTEVQASQAQARQQGQELAQSVAQAHQTSSRALNNANNALNDSQIIATRLRKLKNDMEPFIKNFKDRQL